MEEGSEEEDLAALSNDEDPMECQADGDEVERSGLRRTGRADRERATAADGEAPHQSGRHKKRRDSDAETGRDRGEGGGRRMGRSRASAAGDRNGDSGHSLEDVVPEGCKRAHGPVDYKALALSLFGASKQAGDGEDGQEESEDADFDPSMPTRKK